MSFEEFYYGSYRRLFTGVRFLCQSQAETEDVVAHAYLKAWESWRRVARLDSPEAWVRRVAINKAIDLHRDRGRARQAFRRLWPGEHVAGPEVADTTDLISALQQLPHRQRTALVLHYVVDLSVQDVAREMRIPVGTVKTHLARGRARLAALWPQGQRVEEPTTCP